MAKRDNITDIFVIGGGVNGCGIARDAAGRGYSVMLAEMGDLASGTSSAATKLVHGGLRYLEYYEFRLVHEALAEREVLWAMAPHIIWPLRFVLPHHKGLRPAWLLRLGLFVYDYMGGRKLLPPTKTLDLRADPLGQPLKHGYAQGVRIFGLLGRRRAAGGADCARCRRPRRASSRTRTKVVSATPRRRTVDDQVAGPDDEAARHGEGAAAGQCGRPVGRPCHARDARPERRASCAAGQGQPHRRAEAVRSRPRLFLPEQRRADHLRHPLRARLHADRHDRPRLSPATRTAIKISEEEQTTCSPAATEYFEKPVTAGHRLDLFRRAAAVRRSRQRAQEATRDYVLRPRATPRAAPSSTSSAASSRPIGG